MFMFNKDTFSEPNSVLIMDTCNVYTVHVHVHVHCKRYMYMYMYVTTAL